MTFIWTILQYLTSQIIRIWKYRFGGSNQKSTAALLLINQLTLHKILLIYKLILLRSLHSGRRDYELCRTLIKPSWTTYDSRYSCRRGVDNWINLCLQTNLNFNNDTFSATFLHWRQYTDCFHVWDMRHCTISRQRQRSALSHGRRQLFALLSCVDGQDIEMTETTPGCQERHG